MQALHHKLDVVLVQILHYNCLETNYSFCEDSPPSRTPPSIRMRVSPSDPFSPHYFFRSSTPAIRQMFMVQKLSTHNSRVVAYFMLTFPKTRISRVFVSRLPLPAVKSPQTENTRSTYACDAGAKMMSAASGDSSVAGFSLFPCLVQLLQCFWMLLEMIGQVCGISAQQLIATRFLNPVSVCTSTIHLLLSLDFLYSKYFNTWLPFYVHYRYLI